MNVSIVKRKIYTSAVQSVYGRKAFNDAVFLALTTSIRHKTTRIEVSPKKKKEKRSRITWTRRCLLTHVLRESWHTITNLVFHTTQVVWISIHPWVVINFFMTILFIPENFGQNKYFSWIIFVKDVWPAILDRALCLSRRTHYLLDHSDVMTYPRHFFY